MIIQCPKCLTKFKMDDSKVKDEGTKVRCSKCKEVFVVTKEEAAPPAPPAPPEMPSEREEFDFSFGPSAEEKEEAPFGFGGFEEEAVKKEEKEEAGISFGGPLAEETKEEEEKGTGFEWGGMAYGEVSLPESEEARPIEKEAPSGLEFKEEESPFGEVEFKEEPHFEPPHEEPFAAPIVTPPPAPPTEGVEFREEMPGPGAFEEEKPLRGFEEEGFPMELPREAKKEKRRSFLRVIILFVVICAVAAVPLRYLWKNYQKAETGEITLADLNGYYTQNAEAGNIFVVTGRAVNNTNKARSFFQVRGTLFNKKGDRVGQKEVYCGNIFTPKEISTLPRGKVEADLKNKVGSSLSNINLAPGKSVPFMIVFFDLPGDMAEFAVEATGSQVASE